MLESQLFVVTNVLEVQDETMTKHAALLALKQ